MSLPRSSPIQLKIHATARSLNALSFIATALPMDRVAAQSATVRTALISKAIRKESWQLMPSLTETLLLLSLKLKWKKAITRRAATARSRAASRNIVNATKVASSVPNYVSVKAARTARRT
jgi:hypothetical protein